MEFNRITGGFGDEPLPEVGLAKEWKPGARPRPSAGRPAGSDSGGYEIANLVAELYARGLGVDLETLLTPSLLFKQFPEWPTRKATQVVSPAFMDAIAAGISFEGDGRDAVEREGDLGLLAGAILFDGCIFASATHPEGRKNPIIRAKVSIAQSDRAVLDDLQRMAWPLYSTVHQVGDYDREDIVRTAWRLDFDGPWAIAILALTFRRLLSHRRQALTATRLFTEGLYFAHPRCAGWPVDVWEHREDLVRRLSAQKGRLNSNPRKDKRAPQGEISA